MADPRAELRLVDTSVWIRADRKRRSPLQERLKGFIISGAAFICWPVRAELLIGARDEARLETLDDQLSALPHLAVTEETWRQGSRIGRSLARTGKTVPLVDLLIASIAMGSGMTLWTVDLDFERIEGVSDLDVDWFGVA